MEEATARKLRFVTLQVVGAVAVIHLVVGIAELIRFARGGLLGQYFTSGQALSQPTPWLFTLAALAILAGLAAVSLGHLSHRRAYALGIVVMATFILGWLAWHSVFEHGATTPSTEADTSHEGLLSVIATHYVGPLVGIVTGADQPGRVTLAVISKTLESIAIVLMAVLLAVDPRVEEPENPIVAMGGEGTKE
ncbi:MAG: hypothetical protein ACI8UR_002138 [Natronomonas sp.]|jgi:hypothetical protein|uniref:hypothetical protein n=1 Tax=Natronomonas sp. TaxID=2184060 RepID=UPI003989C7D5